jgi:mannose-6-phosphate isomerase-like protein (cupin superfamily)
MIRAGFTIESPRTGTQTVVVKSDAETGGNGWELELHCRPKAGPDIAEHLHLNWTERFEIVSGSAHYKLGGVRRTAQAGESFVVLPRQLHVHPWNAGEAEMVYRQIDMFDQPSSQAVQDVLGTFATIAGLTREGKVGSDGRPKNFLQLVATMRTLSKHGGYDARISIGAQNFIAATFGRLAEALGYRAVYPRFINL